MSKKQKKNLIRIIITAILYAIVEISGLEEKTVGKIIFLCGYIIIGYDILRKAIKGVVNHQIMDENFLMAVASVGSIILNEISEAVMVMLLYQIGEFFQSYAVGKSRDSIVALMNIRADYANIEKDGSIVQIDPYEIEIGTVITVLAGEMVPIDGIVVEGCALLNTSALTGESMPVEVKANDEISSGCIDMNGVLKIRTTELFDNSTASRILDLVENATNNKAKSEEFISKFARIYTPIVCSAALFVAIAVPAIIWLIRKENVFVDWIYRGLTFLVISCPCAFVISIPLTFFAAIGSASRKGILIKGSNYIETLTKVRTVAFDKTGTITKGVFEVIDVHHNPAQPRKVLEYAALAESYSSHPIARSLVRKYDGEIDMDRVSEIREISDEGVVARIDNREVLVGNSRLMINNNIKYKECTMHGTIIHVAVDGQYYGHVVIADVIKPNSGRAIERLKQQGINSCVMLTGDRKEVAEEIASEIGIDEVRSELKTEDKYNIVMEMLKKRKSDNRVMFVGDGLNDAPVLTAADIGLSMGVMGTAAAIEAADVVLMDDDLSKINTAIDIARKCMIIVYENIIFAAVVKIICLILGAAGISSMFMAIFADVGVMILTVINSLRCLK